MSHKKKSNPLPRRRTRLRAQTGHDAIPEDKTPNLPLGINDKSMVGEQGTGDDSTTGTYFHLFPKLPPELRLKIWRLNSPEPCVITQLEPLNGYKPLHTIMASRPTPAVLHSCQESRNEFICGNNDPINANRPRYRPFFEDGSGKKVFFSFEVDALHLMDCKVAEPLIRKELRHMVVGDDLPPTNTKLEDLLTATPVGCPEGTYWSFSRPNILKLPNFKKLQTLIVVILPPPEDDNQTMEALEARVEKLLKLSKNRTPEFKAPRVIFKQLWGQFRGWVED
ncbi:hypothetical protein F5882DRAFT_460140 [Hyaloscypha sp. PMI_1271]|nr:hypothetical protein F5882DRAFT_460140 [Hyaloscypha sp. PMI_1271]